MTTKSSSALNWLRNSLGATLAPSAETAWPPSLLKPLLAQVGALKKAGQKEEAIEMLDAAYAKGEQPVIGLRLAATLLEVGCYQRIAEIPSLRQYACRDFEIAAHLVRAAAQAPRPVLTEGHEALEQAAYVGMVKNEEDILLFNLVWHYALGLRKFFLMDNGSTDATRQLISLFEQHFADATVLVLNDPVVAYVQGRKMSAASAFAHKIWPELQWLFLIDADEFITVDRPLHRLLKDIADTDALILPKSVYALTPGETAGETDFFFRRMQHRKELSHISNKIVMRAGCGFDVSAGNHRLVDKPDTPPTPSYKSIDGLTMHEFPIRSAAQFVSKVVNGGRAVEAANLAGNAPIGAHWTQQYQVFLTQGEAGLRKLFEQQVVRNQSTAVLADPLPLDRVMDQYLPDWQTHMGPILKARAAAML